MTDHYIITLYDGPKQLAVTCVDSMGLIHAEIMRVKELLHLPRHSRVEVSCWAHARSSTPVLRERFEWEA
jgi:hypothetical protein